jgi:uncharacterized membrane protein
VVVGCLVMENPTTTDNTVKALMVNNNMSFMLTGFAMMNLFAISLKDYSNETVKIKIILVIATAIYIVSMMLGFYGASRVLRKITKQDYDATSLRPVFTLQSITLLIAFAMSCSALFKINL